jgi:hypothetical protein
MEQNSVLFSRIELNIDSNFDKNELSSQAEF